MSITKDGYKLIYLDASAFKESACLERLRYVIDEGLRAKETSSALVYGTAVHKFIAELRHTGGYSKAIQEIINYYLPFSLDIKEKDFRTALHLASTCKGYYEKVYKGDYFLPIKKNGIAQIEQKFAFPATDIFPQFRDKLESMKLVIILSGTVDEIGVIENDCITIKDIKTTTQWNIAEYLETYWLSTQMLFYILIVEHLLGIKNVGAMIDTIILSGTKPTEFYRSEVMYYSEQKRASFKRQLEDTIDGIINNVETSPGLWQQNFTVCDCAKFQSEKAGQCSYFKLCKSEDEEIKASYKKAYFNTINYNPLEFDQHKI